MLAFGCRVSHQRRLWDQACVFPHGIGACQLCRLHKCRGFSVLAAMLTTGTRVRSRDVKWCFTRVALRREKRILDLKCPVVSGDAVTEIRSSS